MREIVTVDGKQFELMTEYPLTEQQRQQTISDIRKQSGCGSCNRTQSLGGNIQTLAAPCLDVTVQAPATIAVTNITILGEDCTSGTCPALPCASVTDCAITKTVVVTYENSGDLAATITPTLTVTINGVPVGSGYTTTTVPTPVPAKAGLNNGSAVATFTNVLLNRGTNHICAGYS